QANQKKYDSAKLSRIYIPKTDPDLQASLELKQAYQQKVALEAESIQERAAKGEPAETLQKEAYTTLGISGATPKTELNEARRGMFPPKLEQEIFSHNAGEVFRADDASGYMIYRVEKREEAPLDSVKEDILRDILRKKVDEKVKELKAPVHANLDEKYFGPAPANAPAGPPPAPSATPK
ncbi:MAG TPA: hypothetical protein VKU42_01245, partial [Candidatus Angelobacter sp.]|nr:hypothetical protein [Candidatus Angelobacter sp.]